MHLSQDDLIDVAEGATAEAARPHLAGCARCREQLAVLRATMEAVRSVDVPEPSPLFWDHLSARVRNAVEAEPPTASGWWAWRFALPAAALVAVVLALAVSLRGPVAPGGDPSGPPPPTSSTAGGDVGGTDLEPSGVALGDLEADPSLMLIADLAADMDWDADESVGLAAGAGALDAAVGRLTEEELHALRRILEEALSRKGA
jgi:hypothetical protein